MDRRNLADRLGGAPEKVNTREIELRFRCGRLRIALLSPIPTEGQVTAPGERPGGGGAEQHADPARQAGPG